VGKRKGRRDRDGPSSRRCGEAYLARALRFAGAFRFAGTLARAARAVADFFVFFAIVVAPRLLAWPSEKVLARCMRVLTLQRERQSCRCADSLAEHLLQRIGGVAA
jgi:hypothetical protein